MINEQQKEPLVSVIIPCYNDGAYLSEAVASVRDQTWKETEIIVIDDGSDDPETIQVIQDLPFSRKNVLHTSHIGPAAARNRGIEAASGSYILPLDADDRIEPSYIEKALKILRSDDKIGAVFCHADLFGEVEGPWELPEYSLKNELLDNCVFVTALFRKSDWQTIGGFCEDFHAGMEDYDFWLSLLESGKEIRQLPEVLFHYRIKKGSRTDLFQENYDDVQNTYAQLYLRHRKLYRENMDTYCLDLRRNLIDQLRINQKLHADPLILYILDVRALKPRMARFLEGLFNFKNRIRRLIGRV